MVAATGSLGVSDASHPHNRIMKKPSDRHARALNRSLISASAGAILLVCQTSCGGLGLGKKGDGDDSALIEPDGNKKSRGSMFDRAKNRNAWIDDNIQTTRRDRYAAQNTTTFAPVEEEMAGASSRSLDARPVPNDDFAPELDSSPDPAAELGPNSGSNMAARSPQQEERLQLPTLDSDFPQPGQTPRTIPEPSQPSTSRDIPQSVEDEGYIPLQPKLPGAEQIDPPKD